MFNKRLAIDLGSNYVRVMVPKKGIVVDQPSVIAVRDSENQEFVAVGDDAVEMVARTPESLIATRPIVSGVIADFRLTRQMLEQFINQALGSFRLQKPEAMLTVSAGATATERRAVKDVAKAAGVQTIHLIDSAVAATLGAGVKINDPAGTLIVHMGGGSTEVAIISLSGVVASSSIRVGGRTLDEAIIKYIRFRHNVIIGSQAAEHIKNTHVTATRQEKPAVFKVNGRDGISGMPKTIEMTSNELVEPLEDTLEKMMLTIRSVLERTSPELVGDVIEKGLLLSGGVAQLSGIDDLTRKVIGVPCSVVQDPMLCAVKGANLALENLEDFKRSLFNE